jgi:hypothetical protein
MFYLNRYKKNAGVGNLTILRNKNNNDFKKSIIKNILRNLDSTIIFTHAIQDSPIKNDYPYFVNSKNLKIEDHIYEHNKNQSYDKKKIEEIIDSIVSKPIPLDKPLWDVHIVYNYDEQNNVGIFRRVHHAACDGDAMSRFHDAIFDEANLPKEKSCYKTSKTLCFINHNLKILKSKFIKLKSILFTSNTYDIEESLDRKDLYQGLWKLKMSTNQSLILKKIDISKYKDLIKSLNISTFELSVYLTASVYKKYFNTKENNQTIITVIPDSFRKNKDKLYGNKVSSVRLNLHLDTPSNKEMLIKIKNSLKNEVGLVRNSPLNGYTKSFLTNPKINEIAKSWDFINKTTWTNRKKIPAKIKNSIYVSTSTSFKKIELPKFTINGNEIISMHPYSMVICTPGSIGCSATYRLYNDELHISLIYIKELFKDPELMMSYYDEALLDLQEMCDD